MSDSYHAHDDDMDVDEFTLREMDDYALAQAIQNSLEEQNTTAEEAAVASIPSFSPEEIAEDERRRERELYGPPTPPPIQVFHQNPTAMIFEPGSIAYETTKDFLTTVLAVAAAFITAVASAATAAEPGVQPSEAQADAGHGWTSPISSTGAVASSSSEGSPPADAPVLSEVDSTAEEARRTGETYDEVRARRQRARLEVIEAQLSIESERWESRLRPGRNHPITTPAGAAHARSAPAGATRQVGDVDSGDELDCFPDEPLPGAPPGPEQQQENEQEQSPRPKTQGSDGRDKRSG